MLYYLLPKLVFIDSFFNVFNYITTRSGMAMFTAFALSVILAPITIKRLTALKVGQVIRDDGPETHLAKAGTPTMGGVLIIGTILVSTIMWADLTNKYVIMVLIITVGFAAVGFIDDFMKIRNKDSGGLNGKYKIVIEAAIGLGAIMLLSYMGGVDTKLMFPFVKEMFPDITIFYLVLALVVLLASTNAVNLTDGLDGLAIFPVVVVAMTFGVIAYLAARSDMSSYLYIPFINGAGEMTVFCAAIMGAGLGFLWYNCHPAQIFMGDVGALGLGGALGAVAIVTKHELVLIIVGGIFVAEALSVILQVLYFKMSGGKRIFKMAPLHHHFEQSGWKEEQVIVRFWIVQILLAMFALATLKLR
jgi:phospho-N-acetylmuramoyl-pentapeptide-transferase